MASNSKHRGGEQTGLSASTRQGFRAQLLAWFDEHQRQLPWRHVEDAYAVWVSEIMLQQTQVATVIDYFERWMERFPTVEALAIAEVEEVLEMWSGLGYYRRARYLHRAAGVVVDAHAGALPETVSELKALPGIGPYTAGAIASIAFGQPEPLVDGNVMRVLSRVDAIEGDPKRAPAKGYIWGLAAELVDSQRPGDFNQALMELGSQICTPGDPKCSICPVRPWCKGFSTGAPEQFPSPGRVIKQRPMRARSCVVYTEREGKRWFLLRRRPARGLLGGLWEFPSCEREGKSWPVINDLGKCLAPALGEEVTATELGRTLGTIEHVFSHRRLKLRVHDLRVPEISSKEWGDEPKNKEDNDRWRWVAEDELSAVASAALLGKVERVWRSQR